MWHYVYRSEINQTTTSATEVYLTMANVIRWRTAQLKCILIFYKDAIIYCYYTSDGTIIHYKELSNKSTWNNKKNIFRLQIYVDIWCFRVNFVGIGLFCVMEVSIPTIKSI